MMSSRNDELRAMLNLKADAALQRRMDYLADRCTEGLLTDSERDEYDLLIEVASEVAVLQGKARQLLKE